MLLFTGSRRQQRWIVQGFVNGVCHACYRNPQTGVWEDRVIGRRSDQALIRSLRDGRCDKIPVRWLIALEGVGEACEPYPSLPDMRRFHRHSGSYGQAQVIGRKPQYCGYRRHL